jgi:hypothetical protein
VPTNRGKAPDFEFVDIMFRNGQTRRNQEPSKWRWKPFDFESDWDIVRYQPSLLSEKK